jgi:hypothetical protein
MSAQNIVLVNESRLLRGILKRAIERDRNLHVIAEVDEYIKIPSVLNEVDTDWIILALHPQEPFPKTVDKVLRNQPELKCLVMAADGSRVRMRWIETHETSLEENNLEELLTVLRENKVTDKIKERIVA